MDGIGAEISQKIRLAIKVKLEEIGVRVDEELPDYVMVMVANKRTKEQMDDDLQLFLGDNTSFFTTWLHHVLQKLQEVTVAKAGAKRKLAEDPKKKKKSKQEVDKNKKSVIPKKKIKVEPEDISELERSTDQNNTALNKPEGSLPEPSHQDETIKEGSKAAEKPEESKESKNTSKSDKHHKDSASKASSRKHSVEERQDKSKTPSISGHPEDLDDEDFINIRTDGELLDTNEDQVIHVDESAKKLKGKEKVNQFKNSDESKEKKRLSPEKKSPSRENVKSKPSEQVDKSTKSSTTKIQTTSELKSPSKNNDKLVDARELLNRKKAARQAQNSPKARSRSRGRSESPQRKKRDEEREYSHRNNDRTGHKKREDERDTNRRVNRERNFLDRELYSTRKRMEDRLPHRSDSDRLNLRDRRRGSSNEPPAKRSHSQRQDNKKFARSSKDDYDDCEEPVKRGGLVSRVVPREPSPEAEVDTPMPSVVKVTPRPRRPPSQQPSSTLLMKAISDANKSLANVPPRPDSTQRPRKDPAFSRKQRQKVRVPPEKMSISISNPLAVHLDQNPESMDNDGGPPSPKYDPSAVNRSPPPELLQSSSSAGQTNVEEENSDKEEWSKDEEMEKEPKEQDTKDNENAVDELQPTPEHIEDERMEEMSDTQFVVTLNGYDPDGLFSHGDDDEVEAEGDSWFKRGEQPLLTSTQAEAISPRQQHTSPLEMTVPAVNHSNLIEVELMKMCSERCKYWPACRLGDKCTYYHPTKPCNAFPNCKFGDSCIFIHPQCKFNALCTRKGCIFAHTPAHTPLQTPGMMKSIYAHSTPLPCKFYPNCTNINCPFTHPSRVCKFGLYCTKKDCIFDHGKIAPVDKLKWTRVSTT